MQRRLALVLTAAAVVATAGVASAAPGVGGTGSAVDVVAVTALPGPLTIAGGGVSLGGTLSQPVGTLGAAIPGGALLVSDLRASDLGWYITATYSAPPALLSSLSLGGGNVKVTTSGVVPDALQGGVPASNVSLVTDQDLSTPLTVASTGTNAGSGITALATSYKLRVPANATTTGIYAGTVTYTVASVR